MSLQLVANHLAQKGRGPDSTLVHMSNREVAGLQALAKRHGGELTVNPDTGLPEAGFLDSLIPTIAGAGLTYFSGGAINPLMAAGIVGGISALDSKDLGKGLMAGLGAWGGGSMVGGFAGMGLVDGAATATAPASEAAMQAAIKEGTYKNAVGQGASNFGSMFASKPMETIASFGGGSGLNAARTAFAAAAPAIMADQNVKTTTPAPERGKIRPYTFNAQQMNPSQTGPVSGERRYFNNEFTAGDPYSAANGGLVALAGGGDMRRRRGYEQQSLFTPTTPLPANNMYGASRDAYDYLMGVNPTSGGGQTRPYDPYPINDIRIDDGANLNPNTRKTGTGKYVFDPVTGQYKWIPNPITPVDTALPVFQPTTPSGGGGGGGNRGTDGFDGGPTNSSAEGNGFAPTSQGAYNVSRLGQAVSTFSPFLGAPISAYGNYLARNVDPNYSHEGLNAGPAPTQSTNDGIAGEQAAKEALADGTAAAALQASYDRTTSASSPTATGGEIQNPQTIAGITAADAMRAEADRKEAEAANIRDMLASQVDSGNAMQRALDSQALSQQTGLAGLSMQQAIDSQNASISASSPTAVGGIANLSPTFGTTQSANDGDAGESDAKAIAAENQSLLNRYAAPAEASTVPTAGFFNSMFGKPTQLAGVGFNPFAGTTESATETAPAESTMTDPAQAGIAALAQAQERAEAAAAQAQADREQAGREAARQADANARAQAEREAQTRQEAAERAQSERERAERSAPAPAPPSNDNYSNEGRNAPAPAPAPPSNDNYSNEGRNSGGGGGGGGRVICTHFYSKGEMSREMWRADLDFAFKNFSPSTIRGYQYWAIPYVKLMRKSKLAEDIMRPLAMHRAKEIYHQMGKSPKGSLFGKFIRLAGEPVCFVLGLFVGEQNWQSLWKPAKD